MTISEMTAVLALFAPHPYLCLWHDCRRRSNRIDFCCDDVLRSVLNADGAHEMTSIDSRTFDKRSDHHTSNFPRLTIVVPFYNSATTISLCISSILSGLAAHDEVFVVDDGSPGELALHFDSPRVRVIRLARNAGRGPARNAGAAVASGDVLVFVDSDVTVRPGALDLIRSAFAEDPTRDALFGSYDDSPSAPGLVSQYRNLLHHFTHQSSGPEAVHFWTGLGAVRRSTFVRVGGFDEGRWARDMEEVEFGHKLTDAGIAIGVRPDIQGTHLKDFSLPTMIRTDLLHRAIPWTRLMLAQGYRRNGFVLSMRHRLSAGIVGLMGLVPMLAFVAPTAAAASELALAGLFVWANLPLFACLRRKRSLGFAAACVPLHMLHVLISVLGAAAGVALHLRERRAVSPGVTQASDGRDVPTATEA